MKYIVEFIGNDGKKRWTEPFNTQLAAVLAKVIIPFESRIIMVCVN